MCVCVCVCVCIRQTVSENLSMHTNEDLYNFTDFHKDDAMHHVQIAGYTSGHHVTMRIVL